MGRIDMNAIPTEYAERVLDAVDRIPQGQVMAYSDVAEWMGEGSAGGGCGDGPLGRRGREGENLIGDALADLLAGFDIGAEMDAGPHAGFGGLPGERPEFLRVAGE